VRTDRERFLPALRAGGRYVRHEPVIRTMLLRFVTFVLPAGAVWALLPLIASRQLSAGAGGYGLLFAALGVGAVAGALGLGAVKRHLSSNSVLAWAAALFGLALAALAFTSSMWLAIPLLVLCGFAWSSSVATVTAELQLFLPGWVRARGLGILLMVFLGTQAISAPLWGLAVQQWGIPAALLTAAALLGASTALPDSHQLDRSPLAYWDMPRFTLEPEATSRVVVSVRYEVDEARQDDFLNAMQSMRRSRLRSGAVRWQIYRVGEDPRVLVEQFEVGSWKEHERQHDGRLTLEDKAIEDATFTHIVGRPRPEHLLPANVPTHNAPNPRPR
jgi:MFS family permease